MKNFWTIFLLLTCGVCFGQNLAPNPSFEDSIGCPYSYEQFYNCGVWSSCGPTPDYFNTCCTCPSSVGVPYNGSGFQQPATGQAYCGLYTYEYQGWLREIIGARLASPLTPGIRYYVSMKVSLADSVLLATNNLGISFTTYLMPDNAFWGSTSYPKIYSSAVITDYINWVTISGSFIADSAYEFIEIGNFLNDSLTTVIYSPSPNASYIGAYYYIDDVCVSTDSLTCHMTVGINKTKQNADVSLFPNPFFNQLTFSLADNEQVTVSLYNFLGQQVLQQTFTNSTTINTEQLAIGIYFYELRNGKDVIKTGKVIKQ